MSSETSVDTQLFHLESISILMWRSGGEKGKNGVQEQMNVCSVEFLGKCRLFLFFFSFLPAYFILFEIAKKFATILFLFFFCSHLFIRSSTFMNFLRRINNSKRSYTIVVAGWWLARKGKIERGLKYSRMTEEKQRHFFWYSFWQVEREIKMYKLEQKGHLLLCGKFCTRFWFRFLGRELSTLQQTHNFTLEQFALFSFSRCRMYICV